MNKLRVSMNKTKWSLQEFEESLADDGTPPLTRDEIIQYLQGLTFHNNPEMLRRLSQQWNAFRQNLQPSEKE